MDRKFIIEYVDRLLGVEKGFITDALLLEDRIDKLTAELIAILKKKHAKEHPEFYEVKQSEPTPETDPENQKRASRPKEFVPMWHDSEKNKDYPISRKVLDLWSKYDPSANKKYLPWMVAQYAKGNTKWSNGGHPNDLDNCQDCLSDFERVSRGIAGYTGSKDINTFTFQTLVSAMTKARELTSRSERAKGSRSDGGKIIAEDGEFQLLELSDAKAISAEAWRAYSKDNPNWKGEERNPNDPKYADGDPYSIDHGWCVRNPSYANNYLTDSPNKKFYVVEKDGFPIYAGAFGSARGQIVNLKNENIDQKTALSIYPLFKKLLDEMAAAKMNIGDRLSSVFGPVRLANGDTKPGEVFSYAIELPDSGITTIAPIDARRGLNLRGNKITSLPEGLKCGGTLDISNNPIKELPANLTAKSLNIENTGITKVPPTISVNTVYYTNPLDRKGMGLLAFEHTKDSLVKTWVAALEKSGKVPTPKEIQQFVDANRELYMCTPEEMVRNAEQKLAAWLKNGDDGTCVKQFGITYEEAIKRLRARVVKLQKLVSSPVERDNVDQGILAKINRMFVKKRTK